MRKCRAIVEMAVSAPSWLQKEYAISHGTGNIKDLATIWIATRFTCPDCGGSLSELKGGSPSRFRCHTGHAFSMRSLALAQNEVTDVALLAGLRAMHEKEAILRRLAEDQGAAQPGSQAATILEADGLAELIGKMRSLVTAAPSD